MVSAKLKNLSRRLFKNNFDFQKQQDVCLEQKPNLAKLQHTVEHLRGLGHFSAADQLTHLTRMHSELQDQASLQKEKLSQAVMLREQYHAQRGEVENILKQCQEQIDAVEVLGVAVHTKLDRYKVCVASFKHLQ
jgi:hypothetical protein